MAAEKRNAIVEAALRAPLSAVNLVAVIVGGCSVWYGLTGKVEAQQAALSKLETRVTEDRKEGDADTRELRKGLTDLQATMREVSTNIQWLVRNAPPRVTPPLP